MHGLQTLYTIRTINSGILNEWLIFFFAEGPSDLCRHMCAYDGERVNYVPLLVNVIVV